MSAQTPRTAVPGWYPDPQTGATLRYFDGSGWTQHVAPAPGPAAWAPTPYGGPPVPPAALGAHPGDPVHWLVPTGRNWQSIAAGYLGLFSILLFPAPFAVALGVWALRVSQRDGSHGRGRAVFGIITGGLGTLGLLATVVGAAT
jgi:uncharacterized protein DUF2510/uncharacterized protein DUF4190